MSKTYQRRLECLRKNQAKKENLTRCIREDNRILQTNLWEESVPLKLKSKEDRKKKFEELRKQLQDEEIRKKQEKMKNLREREKTNEIEERNRANAILKETKRQWILNGDARVQQLKAKIKQLRLRNSQATQLAEKAKHHLVKQKLNARTDAQYLKHVEIEEERLKQREEERAAIYKTARADLLTQITDNAKQNEMLNNKVQEEESEIVKRIYNEVLLEEEKKRLEIFERRRRTREDIENFQKVREQEKISQIEREKLEEEKIKAYKKTVESRDTHQKEKKLLETKRFEKIFERLYSEFVAQEAKKQKVIEAEEIISRRELQIKQEREEVEKAAKSLRARQEIMRAFEQHKIVALKKQEDLKTETEEANKLFKISLREYQAEQEKQKLIALEKKKKLREQLRQQTQERMQQQQARQEAEQQFHKELVQEKEEYEQIVAEELKKLLAESKDLIQEK